MCVILTATRIARTFARADADAGAGASGLARFPLLPPPSEGRLGGMFGVDIISAAKVHERTAVRVPK